MLDLRSSGSDAADGAERVGVPCGDTAVWGLFPVGVYLVAAVAIRRDQRTLGTALVAVNAGFFGWLALTLFG